jgi:5-methylcytosine-specific restriction endonuclease McrA
MAYANSQHQRDYAKKHYQANKAVYKERARAHSAKQILANRDYIWNYLLANPCVHCGEKDPIVLQFDHVDPKSKKYNVSNLMRNAYCLDTIKAEIAKCQVLCSNCHDRKTAKEFGWWADRQ